MTDLVLEALNRAPDQMTDDDLDRVISYLRKSRQHFETTGKAAKKEGADINLAKLLDIKPKTGEVDRRE